MRGQPITEFMSSLRRQGVQIGTDGERIRLKTTDGVLPEELRQELTTRKAEVIAFLLQAQQSQAESTIQSIPRNGSNSLSFAQQRLWVLDQLGAGAAYNWTTALALKGSLNTSVLKQALNTVVERHEVLRTTFATNDDGEPEPTIHAGVTVPLPLIDVTHLSDDERPTELERLYEAEVFRPFDLEADLMLRTKLVRLSENEHVLLYTMHHIVTDGWSIGIFARELAALYEASVEGRPSPLFSLNIQYTDFAAWQREWLQDGVLARQLAYWKTQLADAPPLLELPMDRPCPAVQTYRGRAVTFQVDKTLTQGLTQLSRQADATLFMTLLAAFQVLLMRYTGQEDIVVGSPIANRTRRELEPLIGVFVNTLALRADLSGNPTFLEIVAQVRETARAAYAHQDLPFEQLVEALQPERSLTYNPVVQVVFNFQNTPLPNLTFGGLRGEVMTFQAQNVRMDLEVQLYEQDGGLAGHWIYNTDLFDQPTIQRLTNHFQTLLVGIVANPAHSIAELPLLTEAERHQVLIEWNDTATDYPKNKCIHQLFEEQVERTPDAIAVTFPASGGIGWGSTLTYLELNERANQLAHHLQTLGVGPEVLVGICVERSIEMVVGLLGILKAGGAYVPLDPTYPQERLAFMLQDAAVSVLLTQAHSQQHLPPSTAQVVCLDSDWPRIARQKSANLAIPMQPHHLAYVIYTSGSTGSPKGVMVQHDNVVRFFTATEEWFYFNASDVWTLFHSYAFDFSVWEIWGALLYGGRLIVVPYWVSRSPEAFYQLLCEEGVTILNQTPSAFRQLIRAEETLDSQDGLALCTVIFGGEALEPTSLKPWFERHGDTSPQLVNMYGITETTVHVTYRPLTQDDVAQPASLIGGPIPDLQLYILDQHQQPVPIGVPGELYVGGAAVSRGYLNRLQLTQERFVQMGHLPFMVHDEMNQRDEQGTKTGTDGYVYRTGDLVRRLPNGDIEYLGRIDNQVKIRGFRIELGEIEAVLNQHPDVQTALVVAHEGDEAHRYLVAYVHPYGDAPGTIDGLRTYLIEQLPDYMIPALFITLDHVPLTPNGKVDYKALPHPNQGQSLGSSNYVPPRTPHEALLADIWRDVLKHEAVGLYDNYFELGGDSILSIQVLARIKQAGLDLSLQQLFQHQTIHALARVLGESIELIPRTHALSLIAEEDRQRLPADVEDAYLLAALQMGMLFHSEYDLESAVYHDIFSYHIRGSLDTQALSKAIQIVVDRHPVLRTSFALTGYHESIQLVHRTVEIPLPVTDIRHLSATEQEAALDNWFEAEKRRHFEWTKPPLLRFQIHQRADDAFNLTLSFHHAILDGWSVASCTTELFEHYRALLEQSSPYLPLSLEQHPVEQRYRTFIAMEREALNDEAHQTYWQRQMAEAAVLALPSWPRTCRAVQEDQGILEVAIDATLSEGIKAIARSINVPIKSVLLAAHLRVLSVIGNQSDVVTGLVMNGRPEEADGEQVLGLFLNTLPFRLQLNGGTWQELVQQVFQAECELLPFRRYPLAEIQRQQGGHELFQVLFNFNHFHVYEGLSKVAELEVLGGKFFEQTNFAFGPNFNLNPLTGQIDLSFDYNTKELTFAQVEAIAEYYKLALSAMVNEPTANYTDIALLSEPERHQILVAWNDTAIDYSTDKCIHQLFEAQVERTPDAIAVIFDAEWQSGKVARWQSGKVTEPEEQEADFATLQPYNPAALTYRELNIRANQLAHHLQSIGVGPDVLVGICVERSVEMVVGLLGILKAGGVYLPLDPTYPDERLAYMLEDSQAAILLTQKKLAIQFTSSAIQTFCLDSEWPCIAQGNRENPTAPGQPNHLAYVIYTSGSTGQPKGVMVEHKSLVEHIHTFIDTCQVTAADRILQFASTSFDISLEQIFLALGSGAGLVMRGNQLWPSEEFDRQVLAHQITVADLPPQYFHQLIQHWLAERPAFLAEQLRLILIGGEKISPETVKLWQQLSVPNTQLLNAYGPTETTITATCFDLSDYPLDDVDTALPNLPIGQPLPNRTVYILDANLQPTPVGVPGELYIGGAGVARGYLNRPHLTAEKFVANPFRAQESNSRLYKTGDLVRWLPLPVLEDSHAEHQNEFPNIEFIGRIDNQVKIRGFRIELEEIEAVLGQHPDVQDVAVVVQETPTEGGLGQQLVAYLARSPRSEVHNLGQDYTIRDYQDYLRDRLPDYMVPAAFVVLETLPLMPNGKVDRRVLTEYDFRTNANAVGLEQGYHHPRTIQERQLVQIWEAVLGIHPVGIRDNFFELGGHSLLAVQLIARIHQAFDQSLPLSLLFQHPTMEALAAYLAEPTDVDIWAPLVPIQPNGEKPPLFCLPGIGGIPLYFHHLARHLGTEQPFYGVQAVGLDGINLPHATIEAEADCYIKEIRHVQPQGPYHLGGHSYGGLVAFEMAQQLLRQGECVALLALLDSIAPSQFSDAAKKMNDVELMMIMADMFSQYMGQSHTLTMENLQPLAEEERLQRLKDLLEAVHFLPPGTSIAHMQGLWHVFKSTSTLSRRSQTVLGCSPIRFVSCLRVPSLAWAMILLVKA